ncbi:MAG: tetratricopeptide repeat protein [Proteobacteria bacterium]|nr:tetratricopeptide repeat protein [Pseudomonadota bacterium]
MNVARILARSFAVGALLTLAACPNQSVNESKTALAAGNKALGSKQYDGAIVEYDKATKAWAENHMAWYGLGGARAQRAEWDKAADAFSNAVRYADDQPMYQMWFGISLYEKAVMIAKNEQAIKQNKKPEEVTPDLAGVNFEKPLQHLQQATKLNDQMWRAHYYLGRVYRVMDKSKEAATEFSKAIAANPRESGPYIALGEIYRKWDYSDQAIKIAQQGTVNVPGQNEVSDIWYVLGMGYDDKRQDKEAIEAFTKSLESRKDNYKAKFQRGQAYFRQNDYMNAKRDLEEFGKTGGASLDFIKQQGSKMLMDIAVKQGPPGGAPAGADPTGGPGGKLSPEDLVKKANGKK